jgi:molecular chaperone GrpE
VPVQRPGWPYDELEAQRQRERERAELEARRRRERSEQERRRAEEEARRRSQEAMEERRSAELEALAGAEPEAPAPEPSADEIERLKARIAQEAEREIERVKQRIEREGRREVALKTRDVLASFLDVVDDLDRAIANANAVGEADRALMEGVEMTRARFLQKLEAHGVEQEGAVGDPFDPERHEAVATAPAESPHDDGRIVAVVTPGYRIGDELLRAARVVVAKR